MRFVNFLICFLFVGCAEGKDPREYATNALARSVRSNAVFTEGLDKEHFKKLVEGQSPKTTFVCCSDSRVHMHAFSLDPEDNVFAIRTIGNQMDTALGSIKYGVEHIEDKEESVQGTPLLLIVGHSQCGAVTAKMKENVHDCTIAKELEHVKVFTSNSNPTARQIEKNVMYNVHKQVDRALEVFRERVKEGKLIIVGAMYDFYPDETGSEVLGRMKILNVRDTDNVDECGSVRIEGEEVVVEEHVMRSVRKMSQALLQATHNWMEKVLKSRL